MMVRSTARFSRLVLVAPLGIKLRGRDERDIADMHGIERTEYLRLVWASPTVTLLGVVATGNIAEFFFSLRARTRVD
jgi:hypothetical protein